MINNLPYPLFKKRGKQSKQNLLFTKTTPSFEKGGLGWIKITV